MFLEGGNNYGGYDNYNRNNGQSHYEDKYNNINNSYNNRDESRGYKPKSDNYESKYVERPDFGDRFTANRNKTHPSNRGRGGGGGMGNGGRTNPGYNNSYEKNGSPSEQGMPPRFKRSEERRGGKECQY